MPYGHKVIHYRCPTCRCEMSIPEHVAEASRPGDDFRCKECREIAVFNQLAYFSFAAGVLSNSVVEVCSTLQPRQ